MGGGYTDTSNNRAARAHSARRGARWPGRGGEGMEGGRGGKGWGEGRSVGCHAPPPPRHVQGAADSRNRRGAGGGCGGRHTPGPPPPTPGVVVDVDACVPHSTPAPPDPRPPLRRPHKARGRTRPHSPSLHVQKKTVHIPPKGGGGRRASPGVRLEGVVAPCTSTDTNNPCDMDGRREEGGRGRWAGPLRGGHDDGGTNVLNVVWGGG